MATKNKYQTEQAWQTEKQHGYQNGAYVDTNNKGYYTKAEKEALAKANNHETEAEREQQRVYTQGFKNVNDYKNNLTTNPTTTKATYTPSYSTPVYNSSASTGLDSKANFQPSDAYNNAMAYTNKLLEQLNSGRTSYSDTIDALMKSINERASFSYDPDTDPLFQQYLSSSMESGKTAMMDTMAQASALTGGYGSSYATAVANGAYNNYVQQAYDNLPEYYQTALDAYNSETDNLYKKLGMYTTADETEYNRLNTAYQNNLANAESMYNKEYTSYWDGLNYDTSIAQYNQDMAYKYNALAQDNAQFNAKMAYQAQQDNISQANYESEMAYKKEQDALAYQQAQNESTQYESPSPSVLQKALEIYNKKETEGGGLVGLESYVDSLDPNINVEEIADYVLEHGRKRTQVDKQKIKSEVANS